MDIFFSISAQNTTVYSVIKARKLDSLPLSLPWSIPSIKPTDFASHVFLNSVALSLGLDISHWDGLLTGISAAAYFLWLHPLHGYNKNLPEMNTWLPFPCFELVETDQRLLISFAVKPTLPGIIAKSWEQSLPIRPLPAHDSYSDYKETIILYCSFDPLCPFVFPYIHSHCSFSLATSTPSLSRLASPNLNYLCLGKATISSEKSLLKVLAELGWVILSVLLLWVSLSLSTLEVSEYQKLIRTRKKNKSNKHVPSIICVPFWTIRSSKTQFRNYSHL